MAYNDEAYDGFDSPIGEEADSGGFVLLPEGAYPFTIEEPVGRVKYSGSDKMPPCWKAEIKLVVDGGDLGTATVYHNIYLTKRQAWKIKQFFVGIGLVKPDNKNFTPPWESIVGTTGVVEIGNREYNGKKYNEVQMIYDPITGSEKIAEKMLGSDPAPTPTATQPTFSFPR